MHRSCLLPAVFFFGLQLALVVALFPDPEMRVSLFWYCYSVPLFLGAAFALGKPQTAKALMNIGFIPQGAWILDLVSHLVLHKPFLRLMDAVFKAGPTFFTVVISVAHLVPISVVFAYTYRIKPKPISLLTSFGCIVALYAATLFFTPPADNIDYVFHGSTFSGGLYFLSWLVTSPAYIVLWPLFMMLFVLVGYTLQTLLYLWSRPRRLSHP